MNLKVNDKKTSGETSYTEELEMLKFKNDTQKLKLEIFDQNELLIVSLEIDLESKNIDVLSSQSKKLQKLSETELKEVLGYYARFLAYDAIDSDELVNFKYSREYARQVALVENAMLFIVEKEEKIRANGYLVDELHGVIKEICGADYKEPIDIKDSLIYYDKERNCYDWNNGGGLNPALCLSVQDISFYNGVYTIDYVYCYPGDGDYIENSIEDLDKYISTIELSLNSDYKYAKYCINNFDEMTGKKYTDGNYEINDKTDKTDNTDRNDRNDLLISDELIQFDKKFYSIDEIAKQHWDPSMGTSILYSDLDSDGIDDTISINVEKAYDTYSNDIYKYSINGVEFEWYYGTELYIVDFNKDDKNLEIVIFDPGPSDDPTYTIYSKVNGEIVKQKYFESVYLKTDEKGTILQNSWYDEITTPTVYFRYWYLNNSKLDEKIIDIEKIKDIDFQIISELIPQGKYKTYYFTEDFNDVINKTQRIEDGNSLTPIYDNDEFKVLDFEIVKKQWNEDYIEEIYKIKIELNGKDIGYLYHIQWAG